MSYRVFAVKSDAINHLRNRVRWVVGGVETDVRTTEFGSYFRVHLTAPEDHKVISGRPFGIDGGRYYVPSTAHKRLLTVQPTQQLPWRSPVTPSLQAVLSEPELVKVSGDRNHSVFSGLPIAPRPSGWPTVSPPRWGGYFVPTSAPYRIYRRYPVLDESVRMLRRSPVSFMGDGHRFGFPAFTAWVDVKVGNVQNQWAASWGYLIPGAKFWIPHDGKPVERVRAGVVASKSLRDKIMLRLGARLRYVGDGTPLLADIDTLIVGQPYQL